MMGINQYTEQKIREDFANDQAREINRLYCEARQEQSRFVRGSLEYIEIAEDVDHYADVYDEHVKVCEKLGVSVSVKLDYENWGGL